MAMTNHSWKDLKPVLKEFPKESLIGLVQDLYRLSDENKAFLNTRFLSNGRPSAQDLRPYKSRIRRAVCPKTPWRQGIRLSKGRRVIRDFGKAHGNVGATLELMLHFVQCGNELMLQYDDMDASIYRSMISMFGDIVTKLNQEGDPTLYDEFLPKLSEEISRVDRGIGWGYPDALRDWIAEINAD